MEASRNGRDNLSIGYIMKKKCPGGKCEKCIWFREFRMTNEKTGEHKVIEKCGIEYLLEAIPQIYRSVDGCQTAANEARNRAVEVKQMLKSLERLPIMLEALATIDVVELAKLEEGDNAVPDI